MKRIPPERIPPERIPMSRYDELHDNDQQAVLLHFEFALNEAAVKRRS